MDAISTGLTAFGAFLDVIIFTGAIQDQPFKLLISTFERIQQYGLYVRTEKCAYFRTQIKYMGFIFDENCRRSDPENISAIMNIPALANMKTQRSFLGMVNHYIAFISRTSSGPYSPQQSFKKGYTFEMFLRMQVYL